MAAEGALSLHSSGGGRCLGSAGEAFAAPAVEAPLGKLARTAAVAVDVPVVGMRDTRKDAGAGPYHAHGGLRPWPAHPADRQL
eukprot:9006292-Heterocapsa_arctica.AAC.1